MKSRWMSQFVPRLLILVITANLLGCDALDDDLKMQNSNVGQIAVECGTLKTQRGENGGLMVHDGDVTIAIMSLGKNSTASDVASIRGSFCRMSQVTPQFGGRNLPESEFVAGDFNGFKYLSLGPNEKTRSAAYLLDSQYGYVLVQLGTVGESFDERKYEESMIPTIQVE